MNRQMPSTSRTVQFGRACPAGTLRSAHRSYNARQLHASATSEDVTATALPALKAELVKMAGSKNGVDLSEEDSKAVMNQLKKFEGLGRDDPERMDLAGSKWRVLFTDTDGPASGKLGPFVGKCSLDFPTETEYIANIAYFGGALSIDLVSTYSAGKNHKIDLDLLRNDIKVFGFQAKTIDLGLKGHHTVKFADEDMRIFVTNMGSTFATVRVVE